MSLLRPFSATVVALLLCLQTLVSARAQDPKPAAPATTPPPTPVKAVPTTTPSAKPESPKVASQFAGMSMRSIGPALTSGRIIAIAVHPQDSSTYYVGAGYGGVWKTVNNGTTWQPLFEREGSYSIGAVVLDANNPNLVWVGTGELNAQRSVGWGDGVYISENGGKSFRNVGLKKSEHIGRIAIDPRDSRVAYVAAQGPLWSAGGERGLYKTTDFGKTWKRVLYISEDTGVTDVLIDPRNPEIVYAASWQRRRHVFTYIGGGPESGIHKSTDGGATWTKLQTGLPGGDLGRIGLCISPANPDLLYATVEGKAGQGGVYCSTDYGASWDKRSDTLAQGMYYGQIVADPKNPERVYLLDVILRVSNDGGRTFTPLGESNKHVDNHAIWIDPQNTNRYLVGCDGGLYETFDRGRNWQYKQNLPITQFYRVTTDLALPFYNIYGGTQDNNSLGGPSRTKNPEGAFNENWFVTLGGDGFHQQVEPTNPDIVYSVLQYGVASRLNRKTGERVSITPIEGKGEPPLRWNWDSPILISPHDPARVYFAANRVFRSDNRGGAWKAISPDLTRQIDRDQLTIMGKVWRIDTVARGQSTSFYGNIVSLAESPKQAGRLYVGTDDGLIQVTEDGGKSWRKIETFPGIPLKTYVSYVTPSRHADATVYAAFDNHKEGDFAPYLLRSADGGRTWNSIVGDLPKTGPVLCIAEDHDEPGLLFVGTEFGAYFTVNGGKNWHKFSALPTIPVRDISLQRREEDIVFATFGRGFYVLDDYSPLRSAAKMESVGKNYALWAPPKAMAYYEYNRLGYGRGSQGASFYVAKNPEYGITLTYYFKDGVKSAKQKRQEAESDAEKKKLPPSFPTAEQLIKESNEDSSAAIITITDEAGTVIRRLTSSAGAGVQRVTWDLAGSGVFANLSGGGNGSGFPVVPGVYKASLSRRVDGVVTPLDGTTVTFRIVPEFETKLTPAESKQLAESRRNVAKLQQAVQASLDVLDTQTNRVAIMKRAAQDAPKASPKLREQVLAVEKKLKEVGILLRGDPTTGERVVPEPRNVVGRTSDVTYALLATRGLPTQTFLDSYAVAADEFGVALAKLRAIVNTDIPNLEKALDAAEVPITPGRLPDWKG